MEHLYSVYLAFPNVSTDTRNIQKDSLFFALRGEKFDANQYAGQALEKGAAYAVVDDPSVVKDDRYILVSDVLTALQQLARTHRNHLSIPVLALTGSNGKTTTKELTRDVLLKKFRVHATKGNLNNHIGVPLTILSAPAMTEFLLIEMGANHQGEIHQLCQIANPNYAMITNIGKAHLEGFGGVEGIKKGKSELYRYIGHHGGKLFINTDDAVLVSLLPPDLPLVSYSPSAMLQIEKTDPALHFLYKDKRIISQLYGAYNLPNIAFAIACGAYFGVDDTAIAEAIASYVPDNNRSQRKEWQTNTLILDAYNANPTSMRASLESFARMPSEKKLAVLGDMLELGDYALEEHQAIIDLVGELQLSDVIFIGPQFLAAAKGRIGHYFADVTAARVHFQACNYTDTLILLKGSRGIAVESILNQPEQA